MATKKITLERINDAVNFRASNDAGQSMLLDGTPSLGGKGNGVRPMEALLMSLAACSAIDVVMILGKMRQDLEDIKVDVEAQAEKLKEYTQYSEIHLNFKLWGELKDSKVKYAVSSSIDKYCSVAKALDKNIKINYSYTICQLPKNDN